MEATTTTNMEEAGLRGHTHTHSLFCSLAQLRQGGDVWPPPSPGSCVTLVGDTPHGAQCPALLLAASSPLLRDILHTEDEDEVVLLLPGVPEEDIKDLVSLLYGEEALLGGRSEVMERLGIGPSLAKLETVLTFTLPEDVKPDMAWKHESFESVTNEDKEKVNLIKFDVSECDHCDRKSPVEMRSPQEAEKCSQTEQSRHRCTECDLNLASAGSLAVHSRSHTGVRPFLCDQCDKTFASLHYLVQHRDFHRVTKDFECEICAKKYQTLNALAQHKTDFHGSNKYQCELCFKLFSAKRYLREHERKKHVNMVNFDCDICGKSLAGKNELKIHRRIHTGEKPFHCDECNKDFRARSTFTIHMKSHSGTKNAVCEECGKRFIQWGDLRKHRRTHTGERPFKCPSCGRTFARKDYLTKHQRTHKDESDGGMMVDRVEVTSIARPMEEIGDENLVLEMGEMVGGGAGEVGGERLQVVTLMDGGEGLTLQGEGMKTGDNVYYVISA